MRFSRWWGLVAGLAAVLVVAAAGLVLAGSGRAAGSANSSDGICALCVLAPSGTSLTDTGNGTVAVQGAPIAVDSAGQPAVTLTGNATITAPSVGVAGTASITGNGRISNLATGVKPTPDPLAGVRPPSVSRPASVPSVSVTGNGSQTISPGVYQDVSITGNGSLTLNPGAYVILGQFSATGNGRVTGAGVTLYLTCNSYPVPCGSGAQGAGLSLTGNGVFNVSGPGASCLPLAVYSDPNNTSTISLTGNGADTLTGIVYAPSGQAVLTGNGSTFATAAHVIAGRVTLTGNGSVSLAPSNLIACTMTLTPSSAGPEPVGSQQEIDASVQTSGGAPVAGQGVTFTITGANPTTGQATTDAHGIARFSYTGTSVGTDSVQATLTEGATTLQSGNSTVTWVKATPQISAAVSSDSVTVGDSVSDHATVSGGFSPTGSVSWNMYAASDTSCHTPLNSTPLTAALSGGSATSPSYTPPAAGTYQFVATYGGDKNNETVSTKCGDASAQVVVSKATPQISTALSSGSLTVGDSVNDRATVSGGFSPTGSVSWNVYAASDTSCQTPLNSTPLTGSLSGGSATSPSYTPTAPGTYQFVATYGGDQNNQTASTKCGDASAQVAVSKATPHISTALSSDSVTVGDSVSDHATVSGGFSPTGSVSWNVYAASDTSCQTPLNSSPLTRSLSGGSATSPSYTPSAPGTYQFVATYGGDQNNETASTKCGDASEQVVVSKAKPQISTALSAASIMLGGQVTDTATISGGFQPGGSVSWNVYAASDTSCQTPLNSSPLLGSLSGGSATSPSYTPTAPGTYQFVATYGGDQDNESVATKCGDQAEQVRVTELSVTGQPTDQSVLEGQPAAFTATVQADPPATVQWQVSTDGGTTWTDDTADAGATTDTLSITSASRSQNGNQYRARFTNAAGVATSSAATLTVDWVGPVGAEPTNQAVSAGQPVSFTAVAAANPSAGVIWQVSNDGGSTWTSTDIGDLSTDSVSTDTAGGQTSSTLSIAASSLGQSGFEYRAVFSNAAGSVTSSAATLTVTPVYTGAQLALSPASAGPDQIGTPQTLTATFTDANGNPLAGAAVSLNISGANPTTLSATTDGSGKASFSYSGAQAGLDIAQATFTGLDGLTVTSNTAAVNWVATPPAVMPVASTPVQGNFYPADTAVNGFSAKPGDAPAFSQTFPNINFNPASASAAAAAAPSAGTIVPTATGDAITGGTGPMPGAASIKFDGASALTSPRTPVTATSNWSLEAWIRPANLSQNGMVIYDGDEGGTSGGGWNGYGFGVGAASSFDFALGGCLTSLYEGTEWISTGYCFPAANQWYHVVETNSNGTVAFYVNGQEVAGSISTRTPTPPSGMFIGGYDGRHYGGSSTRYFNGLVSNAAFYSSALSAAQVAAHYAAGQGPAASQAAYAQAVMADHPAAYYKLAAAPTSKADPWFVDSTSRPFTDLTTDQIGKVNGAIPAQGNGLQAGVGQLSSFEAEFTASFNVAKAGDVTFNVTSEDGFLLGVGGGASRVNGTYENAPASNQSPFHGYPLVGAFDQTCCSTPHTYPVTVHFPAAGSYPYELDYFQHGGQQMSLVMSEASVATESSPLSIYAGYADGSRPAGSVFPFPWLGSPGVQFEGCANSCSFDGGAIRVVNNQSTPATINSVVVHFGPDCTYDIWPHDVSLPPDQSMILAQQASGADNGCGASRGTLDSSDIGADGAPWAGNCNQSGLVPEIDVTADGVTTPYQDSGQVLNTGGVDSSSCGAPSGNESEAWTLIGGQQTTVNQPVPPAVLLSLAPTTVSGDVVGQTQKLTVTALDASGKPVPNLPVRLHVFGANGGDISVTTDANGIAHGSYTGTNAGQDNVSATASISGMQTASNQLIVPWGIPAPPPPPPTPSSSSGSQPPSVAITSPQTGGAVTGVVPVAATITPKGSDTIISWSATLTPAGGTAVTLGSGTSDPPASLGSIDPAQLGDGTYDLAVSASTAGGTATETERITIGTTPGVPAPPPTRSSTGAPSIGAITPANGAVVGVGTGVSADASAPAGDTISSWSITLTPVGGDTPATLGQGDSSQPSPQATLDPSQYAPGPYTLTVTVHTAAGGYATKSETLTLGTGSGDQTSAPPTISPITVGSGPGTTDSNGSVTTAPTPVTATVTPPSGQTIASWTVTAQGSHDPTGRTLASGTGAPPSTLANLDTTQLPNDTYRITVQATDSSGAVQTQSSYLTVSGNLKLGRFLRTYKDLDIPVTGFDMQVNRIYDSTDKSNGDFGIGWHLNLANFVVSTNGPLGAGGWSTNPSNCTFTICGYQYVSDTPHTVTVTWPDKHQEVFDFAPTGAQLDNIDVDPKFTPHPGTNTTSTLQVDGPADITNGFDGSLYDNVGNPWTATRFDLTTRDGRKFVLDTTSGLVSETDRNGNTLTVDSSGVHTSAGPGFTFTRDGQGRITDITGPSGQHLKYAYSPAGDLSSYTDANGDTTSYTYDSDHRLLDTSAAGGAAPIQQLIYDPDTGRLTKAIDGDGNVTNINVDVGKHTETVADPNGKLTTINTYDDRGDLTEKDQIFGGKTLKTTYTYDSAGRLLSTTDPLGHTTSASYDPAGNKTSSTDANGKTTRYQYDSFGQLTAVTGPDGSQLLTITRDANGNPTTITRADGTAYTFSYDASGNPTKLSDTAGVSESLSYNGNGQPTTITDAAGGTARMSYDGSGRLLSQTSPTGTKLSYTYDGDGNVTGVTDGSGHATAFTYDAYGHLLTETDPLLHTSTSTYDGAGRAVRQTDANGQSTTYTYDADGNLTNESFADGDYTTVAYDPLERPVTVESATQKLDFTYDDGGRTTSTTSSAVGAAPQTTLTYSYDAAGNPMSMTGPDGTTTYAYDAFSRLTSVMPSTEPAGAAFNLSYTPGGALAALTRPDGIDDTLAYNGDQLLSRIARSGSTSVAGATYAYGSTGLRTSSADASGSTTYAYDAAGQLTQASPAAGQAAMFSYDAAGNRSGGQFDVAEQLTSAGDATYSYDAAGQLVKRVSSSTGAVTTYDWNARHQLAAVHLPDGSTEAFAYDPLGRRVSVTRGATSTSYVYDGANVHLEYDSSSGSPSAVYTDGNGADQVLEMARDGHRYSYLVDGQGSTVALSDEAGNVVARYAYDAFGTPTISGSVPNPFLYTGREWDTASGLYYYRARYYDPAVGRFISRDPVAHPNPYTYVQNDPTNALDPSGADDFSIGGLTAAEDVEATLETADTEAISTGNISVYTSTDPATGETNYVGITNNIERRAAEHANGLGIEIRGIPDLTETLSRADAKAVEQVLIEDNGGPNGQLLNKINSISENNPIYDQAISRGCEILATIGYQMASAVCD